MIEEHSQNNDEEELNDEEINAALNDEEELNDEEINAALNE
jgi:hypothetical protein